MTEKSTTIRVRQVMQSNFMTISGMTTVAQALEKLAIANDSALLVEKRHDDDEYGLLLISDIARHVLAKDKNPERVNVYEIMAKPVLSVHPEMDIKYCARLLQRFDLTRAPVLENQLAVGLVSFENLVLRGLAGR
ncbi:MAG: CBS domain-containing protein [Wenzhouxiangellaceae bacterium]|nr:CBS domain-containing protein [Wenzhouxiangellaceae bacterium]